MNDPRQSSAPRPGPSAITPIDRTGVILADRYRIVRLLGEGGMAQVYLAEQSTLRKPVAIKIIRQDFAANQVHVDRFLREARAASAIAHENVISITDSGTTPDGLVFFVMEYVDGIDLSNALKQHGAMPWPTVKHISVQLCRALAAAHDRGIIHRDLKPSNCLIRRRPGDAEDSVKLLDFGIAKVAAESLRTGKDLTQTGVVLGTPKYMAPEQALGKPVDARTDIYSLGAMMFEMLAGRAPFEGDNFMHVLTRHISEAPPLPRELAPNAGIPPHVEAIVLRCLAKEAGARFQSAAELEHALEAVSLQPTSMPTGSWHGSFDLASVGEGPPEEASPRTAWWGWLAAAGALFVLVVLGFVLRADQAPPGPEIAAEVPAASSSVVAPAKPPSIPLPIPVEPAGDARLETAPLSPPNPSPQLAEEATPAVAKSTPREPTRTRRRPATTKRTSQQGPPSLDEDSPSEPEQEADLLDLPGPEDAVVPGPPAASPLTQSVIATTLGRAGTEASKCVQDYGLSGMRVSVSFTVAGDSGKVLSAKAVRPHTNTPVGRCLAAVVRKTAFPPSGPAPLTKWTHQFRL